jgi:hypothetical protein
MRFVDVRVEEHEALPDGAEHRFRAQDDGRVVESILWESDDGLRGRWRVEGRTADGRAIPAMAYAVDDSSAGTSILVVGGNHGLRLSFRDSEDVVAEAYLLLSRAALEDDA